MDHSGPVLLWSQCLGHFEEMIGCSYSQSDWVASKQLTVCSQMDMLISRN